MPFFYNESKNLFARSSHKALNEAVIAFMGALDVSNPISKNTFSFISGFLELSDLNIVPIAFSSGANKSAKDTSIKNLGKALGNGDNLVLDIGGALESEAGMNDVIVDEIGSPCLFDLNGIFVGIATIDGKNLAVLSDSGENGGLFKEGHSQLPCLNAQIVNLKERGAEFIFLYVDGGPVDFYEIGDDLATLGVNYVVARNGDELGAYKLLDVHNGSTLSVMESIGTAVSDEKGKESVLLRVRLNRNDHGGIDIFSDYIPLKYSGRKLLRIKAPNDNKLSGKIGEAIRPIRNIERSKLGGMPKPQISISEIYEVLGKDVSEYTGDLDVNEKLDAVALKKNDLIGPRCVAVIDESYSRNHPKSAVSEKHLSEKKPALVIGSVQYEGIPTLVVESPQKAYMEVISAIKSKHDVFTVAITGSVGKTTTTVMVKKVFDYAYDFPNQKGNFNVYTSFASVIQQLTDAHSAYIQEVHGGTKGYARISSFVLQPDIAIVTNVSEVHLSQVGTIENVKKEKLSLGSHLKDDGVLLVNADCKYLQDVEDSHKVVTYAALNQDADFHAENIDDEGGLIYFDIVHGDKRYHAELHCFGIHNVANAIGAFAAGYIAGIDPYLMISGLSRFRTESNRQNLIVKNGINIYADCFNAAPVSVAPAIDVLSKLPIGKGGKRIAVIGDMNELAKKTEEAHESVGKMVSDSNIDVLVTVGNKAELIATTAAKSGKEVHSFYENNDMEDFVRQLAKPGDAILFKASHSLEFDKSIEKIFDVAHNEKASPTSFQRMKRKIVRLFK